jgi:hypothetical protein
MMAMLSFSTIGGLSAHLSSCKKIRQNIAASNNRNQQSYSASMQGSGMPGSVPSFKSAKMLCPTMWLCQLSRLPFPPAGSQERTG